MYTNIHELIVFVRKAAESSGCSVVSPRRDLPSGNEAGVAVLP
jgi:hypothetical protein